MKFCGKCEELLLKLPIESKKAIRKINSKHIMRSLAGSHEHPLMEKCWFASGHFKRLYYSSALKIYFDYLGKIPECKQLLRLAEKCTGLRLIFDFNIVTPEW